MSYILIGPPTPRSQGKSCFNFKTVDKALFKELGALTRQGYQRFKKEGLV